MKMWSFSLSQTEAAPYPQWLLLAVFKKDGFYFDCVSLIFDFFVIPESIFILAIHLQKVFGNSARRVAFV